MKKAAILLIFMTFLFILTGCGSEYREDKVLGKTSIQIESEYGTFDCCGMSSDNDGLYRNTSCGYTVKEPKTGFLGTTPEVLFFIRFDENGIAVSCEEGYRPGG